MKKRFWALIALLLIVSFLVAGISQGPGSGVRADDTGTITIDPNEPGIARETDLDVDPEGVIETAGLAMRKQLKAFNKTFTIKFSSPYKLKNGETVNKVAERVFTKAVEHTGKPDEGDYIRWSVGTMSASYYANWDKITKFTFHVQYNMSKTQAQAAAKKANSVLKSLKLDGKKAYDKIYAIYGYITKTVSYDYTAVNSSGGVAFSSYGALCDKCAVCQGIAMSIYYMMLKSGIDCRIVSGDLAGARHGWNIVKLNGKYYHIDATNDLGKKEYSYFLKCFDSMIRYGMDSDFATAAFKKKYPPATSNYKDPSSKVTPTPTKDPLPTPTIVTYTMKDEKNYLTVVCGDLVVLNCGASGFTHINWSSSDPDMLKPHNYAKKAGKVTITVTYDDVYNPDPDGNRPEITKTVDITILYRDVTKKSDFWYEPTNYLTAANVVKGYDKQTLFKPANDCTRAQMLTFMWRLAGSPAPKAKTCRFSDVKSSDYFYKPVLWAVENGITTGYSDGKFKPQNVCTRAQTVTFLWRMAGKPAPESSKNPFSDVKNTDYFYKATLWASEKKILAGYDDGTFRPDGYCLRRQMVTFLYKYDKFINGKG